MAPPADTLALRRGSEMQPSRPVEWILAPNYLVAGRINLLVGAEGCGKSAWTIRAIACVTTGTAWGPFVIQDQPEDVLLIATEDGWTDSVRPRLERAGADLSRVYVFSEHDDGEGSPTFPDDMALLRSYPVKPRLVVVDAWVDTVPAKYTLKNPQDARNALQPWKSYAAATGAAVLLVTHTNRLSSGNARDTYGLSGALRQSVRSSLYAIRDAGGQLIVGPEKSNTGRTDASAQCFAVTAAKHFEPSLHGDGTVALLEYVGPSAKAISQHISEHMDISSPSTASRTEAADVWVRNWLSNREQVPTHEFQEAGNAAGFTEDQLQRARQRVGVVSEKVGTSWFVSM